MGSPNDMDMMKPAAEMLERFGIEADVRVHSAHRTPAKSFSPTSTRSANTTRRIETATVFWSMRSGLPAPPESATASTGPQAPVNGRARSVISSRRARRKATSSARPRDPHRSTAISFAS
jgi:hypothetical protein